MFFDGISWMMGKVMSLEGLRKNQMGGTMLACFIELESDMPTAIPPKLDYLRTLAELMIYIVDDLPDFLEWVGAPFRDYSLGALCFIYSLEELSKQPEIEHACAVYW